MERILIHPKDNVEVAPANGQKYARAAIKTGEAVIKYGFPIGFATRDIAPGEHVHSHNLRTGLGADERYDYIPKRPAIRPRTPETIRAFVRKNGKIGLRNHVWIIPTVGCINGAAGAISRETGALCFTHPYGCSQLGDDLLRTRQILCGLIKHPNAGGVLVLGLGCENNEMDGMRAALGVYDPHRTRFLIAQNCEDEIAEGIRLVRELQTAAAADRREEVPVSKLILGLKCGGSDGYSGVTANPAVGRMTDKLISMGGAAALTEVPEMFGAERILMERCVSREIFNKTVALIGDAKNYFRAHGQPVSENPSPGNKAGGITTLEEKSLGCVQKGGTAPITDVLDYGETIAKPGLSLINGPGNDGAAVTNLTAAGCHMILFTTGRGTPLGSPVPTLKIASNTALAKKKANWIDFDAMTGSDDDLWRLIRETAEGKPTKQETGGYYDIAIFKDGVTL